MTLSVIIVNYNVKYFLEQCLESVYHSQLTYGGGADRMAVPDGGDTVALADGGMKAFELEVFVVDNASVDGSVEMVRRKYPQVHLIANNDNPGFAKANNQAIRQCKGDLILLLNPDTVVERDTFSQCVEFFEKTPDCGGLTVKMVNGEGKYLKESKRGFPTPAASFYKMSGLIHLFPHSKRIAAYYMGHLGDDNINAIDILPGAYLMFSREAYNKVGVLDESYFMYGEDIDFSWRIKLAGFQNYYLPTARIIHYKGESTKHGSMNYVYTFYNAMSIFVKRYFSGGNARLFNSLLHVAIWARACLAWLKRMVQAIVVPLTDFAVAFAGFLGLKYLWATYWASNVHYYPAEYTYVAIPCYILVLMLGSWLYGGYLKPVRLMRIVKGMLVGSALLLVFYSLLNESQRYSRALLLLGCAWTLLSTLGIRGLLSLLHVQGYDLRPTKKRSCLIIGCEEESLRVKQFYEGLGSVKTQTITDAAPDSKRVNEIIHYYKVDEVVFCNKDIATQKIIDMMTELNQMPGRRWMVEYKIVPSDSDFIIGSNSINSTEDLYAEELRTIATPLNRRNKRLLDIVSAMLLLVFSPVMIWVQNDKQHYFAHCWHVLTGRKTWVGTPGSETREPVFGPEDALPRRTTPLSPEVQKRLYLRYMRNYKLTTDIQILLKNIRRIGEVDPKKGLAG